MRDPSASPLALLVDLYELTMAYGYWKLGRAEEEAVFHLSFRRNPFDGAFSVSCGLGPVAEFLRGFRFDRSDLEYLERLTLDGTTHPFEPKFLRYLADMRLTCDVDAVEEGTPVFPHEPLVRVRGPLLQAQILETPLLNLVNFSTLIATKAARICQAAQGEPVLEFGLRRAQGIDGGLSASRAAYIGGCAGTSNVLAGKLFDIPVRGTHAHSWVMSFEDEVESFEAYARALPDNCIFLVDTYDTLEGVRRAIEAGRRLREAGHEMKGIRLDSGDLVELSIRAREELDAAGFPDVFIVGSGDLDEHRIAALRRQGARIGVWGVGTRLATGHDDPALTGVYKLAALRQPDGTWRHAIKLSEETAKQSLPGILQVRRYQGDESFLADVVFDLDMGIEDPPHAVPPTGHPGTDGLQSTAQRLRGASGAAYEDLLVPVLRRGELVYEPPSAQVIRGRAREQLAMLPAGLHYHGGEEDGDLRPYPVLVEHRLDRLRERLRSEADG